MDFLSNLPIGEISTALFGIIIVLLKRLHTKLSQVTTQVTNNGGSSMKDAIDRVEYKIDKLYAIDLATMQLNLRPMIKFSTQGELVWANTAFLEFSKKKEFQDLKGVAWQSIFHEQSHLEKEIEKATKDRRRFDVKLLLADGATEAKFTAYPLVGSKDAFIGFLGTVYADQ